MLLFKNLEHFKHIEKNDDFFKGINILFIVLFFY